MLKKERYDYCVMFSGVSVFVFAFFKKFFKYKFIYSIRGNFINHGNISNELNNKNRVSFFFSYLQHKFYFLIELYILKKADKVVFQSIVNADEYKEMYKLSEEKIFILHNNCNPSWVRLRRNIPIDREKFNIAYIGNVFRAKGIEVLIDAFELVYKKSLDVTLTVIGDGPDRSYYEKYTKELECCKNVAFLGRQENASELMHNFDLIVVPSYMEAFPNVALEAIYHKVPVLGSNVGGIPVILGNKYVFEVGNSIELSKRILMCMESNHYKTMIHDYEKIRESFLFDWSLKFSNIIKME
jgi:glycosyltransferase involved in cell wall biosynthesis